MKKNYKIILLLVVLAILCVPLILFFSSVDETQDISTQSRGGDILNNKIIKILILTNILVITIL